jgi:hypothetical protein
LALSKCIIENIYTNESIVVFDRGLQSRKKIDALNKEKKDFVTRIAPSSSIKIIKPNQLKNELETTKLFIQEEMVVKLKATDKSWTEGNYRLIKAIKKSNNEKIYFLTNNFELTTEEVTVLYKQRWEIEIFFKFLKQHLNLTHLVSRNENAIKVIVYMTMIVAILILAYKKLNKIKGFKIAKLAFEIELDNLMIKEIVILSGGNPDKVSHLWNST